MISRETIEQLENFEFNPMNDVAFKFIFGSEERKKITLAFLNAVLEPSFEQTITDLKFVPKTVHTADAIGNVTSLGVVCIMDDKKSINVEIRLDNCGEMHQRTTYSWIHLFNKSLNSCCKYQDIDPAVIVKIQGFNMCPEPDDAAINRYSICSLKTGRRLNSDMELHVLDIPNYRLQKKIPVAEMTSMERWLAYFANNLDAHEKQELAMADEAISSAMEESSIFLNNKVNQREYIERKMDIWDYNANIAHAKEEGRKEGKEEEMENIAVALLRDKFPIEQIQRYTSLSPEKIEQLAILRNV